MSCSTSSPTDADIESAVDDISFFLGALEGSADAVVEQQVLPFPSTQVDPYRGFAPHLKVASARARALHSIANGTARVVVASAPGLLPRLPDPAALMLASHEIKPGMDIDPHALANTLVAGGYEPADPVDAHGEFGRRGGILDIFPAGDDLPVRIEFIGDTVESIRRFDPGTQRSVETLDRFGLVPVREGVGGVWPLRRRICFSTCPLAACSCCWQSQLMSKNTSTRHGSRLKRSTPKPRRGRKACRRRRLPN